MAAELRACSVPSHTLDWLLDPEDPSPRYLTLTKLLGEGEDSSAVRAARAEIPRRPPAVDILQAQYPQGYWMHPGIGASPRYRATLWQILILAQLGLGRCGRVERAAEHLFAANQREDGAFRASKESGDVPIELNASLLWALERLGYGDEPEATLTWGWLIREMERQRRRSDCQDGGVSRWGVEVLWALNARLSGSKAHRGDTARLDGLQAALAERLLARLPAPHEAAAKGSRLTFPLLEGTDPLHWLTVLVGAGCGEDPRLDPLKTWLRARRLADGAWPLERIPGKLWADVGAPGESNKWITIRALAVGARPCAS